MAVEPLFDSVLEFKELQRAQAWRDEVLRRFLQFAQECQGSLVDITGIPSMIIMGGNDRSLQVPFGSSQDTPQSITLLGHELLDVKKMRSSHLIVATEPGLKTVFEGQEAVAPRAYRFPLSGIVAFHRGNLPQDERLPEL